MGALEQISEKVRNHIRQLIKSSGLPDTEESVEKIAQNWLDKKQVLKHRLKKRKWMKLNTWRVMIQADVFL